MMLSLLYVIQHLLPEKSLAKEHIFQGLHSLIQSLDRTSFHARLVLLPVIEAGNAIFAALRTRTLSRTLCFLSTACLTCKACGFVFSEVTLVFIGVAIIHVRWNEIHYISAVLILLHCNLSVIGT